jgi:hypothetical protein
MEQHTEDAAVYEQAAQEIHKLVSAVSEIIQETEGLKDKNFGLFYQHQRISYLDLDAFAQNVDTAALAEKLTNEEKSIDKTEE